ncbi:MAG: hypothetical protein ACLQU2_11840 [Candidatus Binataceae bacterium]
MPRVYVGNLTSSFTSHDLVAHFSRAGEVRAALVASDKPSGQCGGFGLVEMAELADPVVAFSFLNNTALNRQGITFEPQPSQKHGRSRRKWWNDPGCVWSKRVHRALGARF